MGSCCTQDKTSVTRNRAIDALLADDKKKKKTELKILFLGAGESGKSTIFKQMKIIQDGGFPENERLHFKKIVYSNCVTEMQALAKASNDLQVSLQGENQKRVEKLMQIPIVRAQDAWSKELAEDIKHLWQDTGIRQTFDLRDRRFQLNETAAYFFNEIDRISADDYLPTNADILRARIRSTGINETKFTFEGGLTCALIDVGGQRGERRKWIHCFEGVTAIIFCVASSEYDQVLREDPNQNRLHESLTVFEEICNNRWFRDVALVLFLNKIDLLEQKIKRSPLKDCFPTYEGGENFEKAKEFIRARFIEKNTSHDIYTHFTCALDTKGIQIVFKAIRDTVLKKVIQENMLVY